MDWTPQERDFWERAAIAAMSSLISADINMGYKKVADHAFDYADAMLASMWESDKER